MTERVEARWASSLLTPAALLAIAGVKLWMIANLSSAAPFWDQWDAEADFLYRPYLEGRLSLADFMTPHNEHRIAFTRALSLGLLELNGWWDTRLQMVVNAALHCVALGLLLALLHPRVERRFFPLVVLATAMMFLPPFGWENTLAGFQSQFYLLMCFSLVATALLVERHPGFWHMCSQVPR